MGQNQTLNITRKVRPIRLAFLVRPNDAKGLQRIFEVNTCLWGGKYNGIIPVFSKTPKWWGTKSKSRDIVDGYINAFEPDYLVVAEPGLANSVKFDQQRIIQLDNIFQRDGVQNVEYGLDVNSIFKEHFEKQYKFQQRYPQNAILPVAKKMDQLFADCIFGCLPSKMLFRENYETVFSPEKFEINSGSLFSLYNSSSIYPLKIGSSFLNISKTSWHKDPTLFLIDHTNTIDLVDFWNLRALGWRILAIPLAWMNEMGGSAKEFAEKNHVPLAGNPNGIMRHTTVLKSRSIAPEDLRRFVELISFDKKRKPERTELVS